MLKLVYYDIFNGITICLMGCWNITFSSWRLEWLQNGLLFLELSRSLQTFLRAVALLFSVDDLKVSFFLLWPILDLLCVAVASDGAVCDLSFDDSRLCLGCFGTLATLLLFVTVFLFVLADSLLRLVTVLAAPRFLEAIGGAEESTPWIIFSTINTWLHNIHGNPLKIFME